MLRSMQLVMTESENTEYMNLMNLWNCTEPMTAAQLDRMRELEECASGLPKGQDGGKSQQPLETHPAKSGNDKLSDCP